MRAKAAKHQLLKHHISNIRVHTSNIPVHTSNIRVHTSSIRVYTSNIPVHTSNIPVHTSNKRVHTDAYGNIQVIYEYTNTLFTYDFIGATYDGRRVINISFLHVRGSCLAHKRKRGRV